MVTTLPSTVLDGLAPIWQAYYDERLFERAGDRITWARYEPLPSPVVSQEGTPMMPKDLLDDLEVGDAERATAMMKVPPFVDPSENTEQTLMAQLRANGLSPGLASEFQQQNLQQSMQNLQSQYGNMMYASGQQYNPRLYRSSGYL